MVKEKTTKIIFERKGSAMGCQEDAKSAEWTVKILPRGRSVYSKNNPPLFIYIESHYKISDQSHISHIHT